MQKLWKKKTFQKPTKDSEPASQGPIDLIHDDDDDEVDDRSCTLHSRTHIWAEGRGRTHMQGCFDGDPVQDNPKHDGKGHRNLRNERKLESIHNVPKLLVLIK